MRCVPLHLPLRRKRQQITIRILLRPEITATWHCGLHSSLSAAAQELPQPLLAERKSVPQNKTKYLPSKGKASQKYGAFLLPGSNKQRLFDSKEYFFRHSSSLAVDQVGIYNFCGSVADIIHPSNPFHLVKLFKLFSHFFTPYSIVYILILVCG